MKKAIQKVNKAKTAARTRAAAKKASTKTAELNPRRFPKPTTKAVFDAEGVEAARKHAKGIKGLNMARFDQWLVEWGAVEAPAKPAKKVAAKKPAAQKAPAKKAAAGKGKKADAPYVAPEGSNSPKTAKGKAINAAVSKAVSKKARGSARFEGQSFRIVYEGNTGLAKGTEGTILEKTTDSAWPFRVLVDGKEHMLDADNFELISPAKKAA